MHVYLAGSARRSHISMMTAAYVGLLIHVRVCYTSAHYNRASKSVYSSSIPENYV